MEKETDKIHKKGSEDPKEIIIYNPYPSTEIACILKISEETKKFLRREKSQKNSTNSG